MTGHCVSSYTLCRESDVRIKLRLHPSLHGTRSNQNLTSLTTCKRLQPVANFASGSVTSLMDKIVNELSANFEQVTSVTTCKRLPTFASRCFALFKSFIAFLRGPEEW